MRTEKPHPSGTTISAKENCHFYPPHYMLYPPSLTYILYYTTTTIYYCFILPFLLKTQSSHFDNDIVTAAGSPRVRYFYPSNLAKLEFVPTSTILVQWDEKLNDTATLSFGFFNNFYVFSIFIITWMILKLTTTTTTTHTHCTYHIMKIYNNLVE